MSSLVVKEVKVAGWAKNPANKHIKLTPRTGRFLE
jgi:hypothetical protein